MDWTCTSTFSTFKASSLIDDESLQILVWYTQDFSAQYIDEFETLPYEIDSVRRHVERIVFASAPWQAWAMDVRSVYRWEQPYTTLKWFVLYVILWYTNHLIGFLVGFTIGPCMLDKSERELVRLYPLHCTEESLLPYFGRLSPNFDAAGS